MEAITLFKSECKLLGFTYNKLAEKLNCHRSSVEGWANGRAKPGAEYAPELSKLGFSDNAILFPTREVI